MSASQQALRIDVSHSAGGGDIHVAANQNRADGGTGFERFGLFVSAGGARAHHGDDSGRGELSGEAAHRVFGESIEDQGSVNRFQIVGEIRSGIWEGAAIAWGSSFSRRGGHGGPGGGGFFGGRLVEGIDLKHVGDRSYAGDRLFREFADAEGERPGELAV